MFITLTSNLKGFDGSKQGFPYSTIPAGRHAVERIHTPVPGQTGNWLVLKGTKIGHREKALRQDPIVSIEE